MTFRNREEAKVQRVEAEDSKVVKKFGTAGESESEKYKGGRPEREVQGGVKKKEENNKGCPFETAFGSGRRAGRDTKEC